MKPNPFGCSWRIVSLSVWEDGYLDEEVHTICTTLVATPVGFCVLRKWWRKVPFIEIEE